MQQQLIEIITFSKEENLAATSGSKCLLDSRVTWPCDVVLLY